MCAEIWLKEEVDGRKSGLSPRPFQILLSLCSLPLLSYRRPVFRIVLSGCHAPPSTGELGGWGATMTARWTPRQSIAVLQIKAAFYSCSMASGIAPHKSRASSVLVVKCCRCMILVVVPFVPSWPWVAAPEEGCPCPRCGGSFSTEEGNRARCRVIQHQQESTVFKGSAKSNLGNSTLPCLHNSRHAHR